MKKFLSLVISIAALALVAQNALAAGNSSCQVVYGGGQVCQDQVKFTINKLVQKPGKGGEYVENLSVNDPRFAPGQNVNFKIVIQNTGTSEIKNLNVVDNFPQLLTFVAGAGATNVGSQKINFTVGTLAAGQKVEYVVTAKIADEGNLPANQAVTCVTNNVVATATDGSTANDNSQACIEKNVVNTTPGPVVMEKPSVKNIPATGPEMGLLAALIPAGITGLYLRRKSN